jgi:class 3 adenylate cyclase
VRSAGGVGYSSMESGGVRLSGTVTFLFTDIEGSTQRWQADSDAMAAALAAHDELIRSVVGRHGGQGF